jgi:transposase
MALLVGRSLLFLDEAAIRVCQDRAHGWAIRGRKPVLVGTNYEKKRTMIGVIAADGVRALRVQEGSATKQSFLLFVREELVPVLGPDETVCMDQLRAHKNPEVIEAIRATGARVLFLPTYSPELNPIEMIWSWLKRQVTKIVPSTLDELEAVVEATWGRITAELCRKCIEHCGYVMGV